jgi:hypothetical protein
MGQRLLLKRVDFASQSWSTLSMPSILNRKCYKNNKTQLFVIRILVLLQPKTENSVADPDPPNNKKSVTQIQIRILNNETRS